MNPKSSSLLVSILVAVPAPIFGSVLTRVCERITRQIVQPKLPPKANNIVEQNLKYLSESREKEAQPEATAEENAFWDFDFFGLNILDGRPVTVYTVRAVDRDGRYQSAEVNFEMGWNTLFPDTTRGSEPHMHLTAASKTLPLLYAGRRDWTVIRLPQQMTESGKNNVVATELQREGADLAGHIFFNRKYNAEEVELLTRLNRLSANYRSYLRRHFDELNRQIDLEPAEKQAALRKLDILRQKISELRRLHSIDIPPNAEGLIFQQFEAPPIPAAAMLHPLRMEDLGTKTHFAVYRNQAGRFELVEFEVIEASGQKTYTIRSLEGYTDATVKKELKGGASGPVTITPILPTQREPLGSSFRLTENQLREMRLRFWVVSR